MEENELLLFRQGLQNMRRLAAGKGNKVSIQEILACFPGKELTREQIAMIYTYAEEEGITIEDYTLHDTRSVSVGEPKLTGEEKAYFKMYLEDLKAVEPCDADEEAMLFERLMNGEDQVIGRLTEGHLHMVLEMARNHTGQGVLIGDLVQEGNMALMMALNDLADGTEILSGAGKDYLGRKVENAMLTLLEEQKGYRKAGDAVARETNRLMAAAIEMEEQLGREASLSELSEKVQLPEDKVKELIRVSLDAAEYANMDEDGPETESRPAENTEASGKE